ncbi:Uncharacterised protein [uncultured archaeon]|nr:Uncharacterised protein [uncultured archaeon]
MPPAFSLVPVNKNPIINKGDALEFAVYITGLGHVENFSKIYISLPKDLVEYNNNLTNASLNLTVFKNTSKYFYFNATLIDYEHNLNVTNYTFNYSDRFAVYVPNYYFWQNYNKSDKCWGLSTFTEQSNLISNASVDPILVKIYTSKNSPEGDNKIDLVLTYSDGQKWYQDKNEVKFHIRSTTEQYYPYILIVPPIIGVLFGLLLNKIFGFKSIFKRRRINKILREYIE